VGALFQFAGHADPQHDRDQRLPAVAQAAPEDIADSAERLAEIMDTYR
jgi:hypothetical protein